MSDDVRSEIVIERNLLIPMKDGASLSADLYRPAGGGKFPALMSFYPYHKDDMIGASFETSRRYFAQRGYAHLLIDFRGLGGSDGVAWEAMHRNEGVDGAQACEWIARQGWCDGNVGMWGLSYGGISSLKVAAENPPHLKAIIPIQGSANIYADYICSRRMPQSLLGSYGAWGSFMLAMNLMPPTNTDRDGRWYRVWMDRLEKERAVRAAVVRASRLRRVLEHEGGRSREDYHSDLHHRRMARHFSRGYARAVSASEGTEKIADGSVDARSARRLALRRDRISS